MPLTYSHMRNKITQSVLVIGLILALVATGIGTAATDEAGVIPDIEPDNVTATADGPGISDTGFQNSGETDIFTLDDEPEDSITTEYFEIWYYPGYQSEAEEIATYADDYYEVLFQKFGVDPFDGPETVVVGSLSDVPCEGDGVDGCYRTPPGNIYVTNDNPGLFYHELTHRYQDVSGVIQPGGQSPLEISVEGTARHLDTSSAQIAAGASFDIDRDEYFTNRDADFTEYEDLALFSDFILHEYDREAFDVLYTESWVWPGSHDELEAATGEDVPTLQDEFIDQLPQQEQRLQSDGTTLPAFTYDPFYIKPGEEVTFDAGTPGAIEELDRTWYPETPSNYEWDLTGDGEIDATGQTVSTVDPAETVTLHVTVNGQTYEAEQELLKRTPELSVTATEIEETTFEHGDSLTVSVDIENTGEDPGSDEFALQVDGEVVDTQEVSVDDSEQTQISFDHELGEEGSYNIAVEDEDIGEVTVLGPADVELTELSFASDRFTVDEDIIIEATAMNTGSSDGEVTFDVIGDQMIHQHALEVPPGETVTKEFELDQPLSPGSHEVELNGEEVEFNVFDPDAVTIADTGLSAETIEPGESVVVSALIENEEAVTADRTVTIELGDDVVQTETITVDGNDEVELSYEYQFDEPGTYNFKIDSVETDVVTVEEQDEADDIDGDGTDEDDDSASGTPDVDDAEGDTPGFGVIIALVAIIAAALLGIRRHN